jgi:HD-like signal output (HDOD) protein
VIETTSRQEIVAAHLQEILKRPDFPVFAETIQEVMRSTEDEETSFRQITNLILKDFSLTLKVLRTANSPIYNRSGKPILTITHAVALLGMEAIRDLAGSMLLFQHYRTVSPGLRELMLLSLLTASHARITAERIHYPRCEEAYLCGMFRNLGEVLAACYLPREYAAILLEIQETKRPEREACLQFLHCTYEELGRAAAEHWNMPGKVTRCMRAAAPRLTKPISTETELLEALTSFSHGLTTAIYRCEPEAVRARLNHLLETHGPILLIRRDEIQEIAQASINETKATFDLLRVPLDDLRLRRQTEAAIAILDEPGEGTVDAGLMELLPGETLLECVTQQLEATIASASEFELTNVILTILEAMYRGVPFDRVLFCLVTPDHGHIQGRLGLGQSIDSLLEHFRFPLFQPEAPIAASFAGRQDLFVVDGRFQDSELVKITGASCFGIYPVIVNDIAVGCFYFDRDASLGPLDEHVKGLLSKLRDLAAAAISSTRQ